MSYYIILKKAKPYNRTRKGRFEHVRGYAGRPAFLPKKFKHPSNNNSERDVDVTNIIKKLRNTKFNALSGSDINLGSCIYFASELLKRTGGTVWETLGGSQHHVWVEHKGRHYDAEALKGVKNWWDLPIFKRYRKQKENAKS
jgi:hypothetical protein